MTANEITHNQAKALAAFIHELRGDWDTPGILDAIGKARGRAPGPALAVAAIHASQDAKNRTPAIIGMDGAHWRPPTATDRPRETPRPPRKDETCPVHAAAWADNCAGCRADDLAGEPHSTPGNPRRPDVSDRVAAIRAELAAARTERQEAKA